MPIYIHVKASKLLSLFFVSGALGALLGYCSDVSQKKDISVTEQEVLEIIKTTADMDFLLKAQKALEIRKYDLYNTGRDQLPVMPVVKDKAEGRKDRSSKDKTGIR